MEDESGRETPAKLEARVASGLPYMQAQKAEPEAFTGCRQACTMQEWVCGSEGSDDGMHT